MKTMSSLIAFTALFFSVSLTASTPGKNGEAPTFTRNIAPILFQNCVTCHRPGEVAPFSLLTYPEVKKRGRQISEVIDRRVMPPWKEISGHSDFVGARRLTDPQKSLIKAWVEA